MQISVWLALIGLFLAGGLTPGPAVMLVMSSSLRYGFRPALLPASGISAGNIIWISLAASGAAALATAFPLAFFALKFVGLGFIVWLAWSMATADPARSRVRAESAPKRAMLFARGVGLQMANPNALVFFGAILPTFFDPERPLIMQVLIIMISVTITEMFGLTLYAWAADAMNRRFANPVFARRFNRLAATLMLGSAIFALITTS